MQTHRVVVVGAGSLVPVNVQAAHEVADDANEGNVARAVSSDKRREEEPHGNKDVAVASVVADDATWTGPCRGRVAWGVHTRVSYGREAQPQQAEPTVQLARADDQGVARFCGEQCACVAYEPKAEQCREGDDQFDGGNEQRAQCQAEALGHVKRGMASGAIAVGALKCLEQGVVHIRGGSGRHHGYKCAVL